LATKPIERANTFLKEFVEMLSFIGGHINIWDRIDWMTTAVGGWLGCGSGRVELLGFFHEFESIILLTHMDSDMIVVIPCALKINT